MGMFGILCQVPTYERMFRLNDWLLLPSMKMNQFTCYIKYHYGSVNIIRRQ